MFITREPISGRDFISQRPGASCGASVVFTGVVRDHHQGKSVKGIEYEGYESMANRQIGLILEKIKRARGIAEVRVLHRLGRLEVGEIAVIVEVSAVYREEAFLACREVMEEIKHNVPLWKKEVFADGTSEWVSTPSPGEKM